MTLSPSSAPPTGGMSQKRRPQPTVPALPQSACMAAQTLAVWADGFVLPLVAAVRRCGAQEAPPGSVRR